MGKIKNNKIFLVFLIFFACTSIANAIINIVAAENVYGGVVKELGGPYVNVINILNNPSQDPHLFSINPSTAKSISEADIIIYNGAGYDPWMKSLLNIKSRNTKKILVVAELVNFKTDNNPHIWYQPTTIPLFAQNIVTQLSQLDPQHQPYYQQQLNNFKKNYHVIFDTVKQLKKHFQNTSIIATEPVFNHMADTIGLHIHGKDFQLSIMNDVPPTISQIKQFEDDLRHHTVKLLLYNNQVINPLTKHMLAIAKQEKIPIVGVSEMLPNKMTYVQWMMKQLTELQSALQNQRGH